MYFTNKFFRVKSTLGVVGHALSQMKHPSIANWTLVDSIPPFPKSMQMCHTHTHRALQKRFFPYGNALCNVSHTQGTTNASFHTAILFAIFANRWVFLHESSGNSLMSPKPPFSKSMQMCHTHKAPQALLFILQCSLQF